MTNSTTIRWGDSTLEVKSLEGRGAFPRLHTQATGTPLRAANFPREFRPDIRRFLRGGWDLRALQPDERRGYVEIVLLDNDRVALMRGDLVVNFDREVGNRLARIMITKLGLKFIDDDVNRSTFFRARVQFGQDWRSFAKTVNDLSSSHNSTLPRIRTIEPDFIVHLSTGQHALPRTSFLVQQRAWPWKMQGSGANRYEGATSVFAAEKRPRRAKRAPRIAVIDEGFFFKHTAFGPPGRTMIRHITPRGLAKMPMMAEADHGTRCASLAAGKPGPYGGRGAAPDANLLLLTVSDPYVQQHVLSDAALARAIEYALNPAKVDRSAGRASPRADIIVSSLGDLAHWKIPTCLKSALDHCATEGRRGKRGTPVFWSVSNIANAKTKNHGVAAHPNVTAIGGCRANGNRIDAATGPDLDLLAPGSMDVYSAKGAVDGGSSWINPKRAGTSWAAPVVAGIAAVILQRKPRSTVARLKDALTSTASLAPRRTPTQGYGVVNALKAINKIKSNS